MAVSHGMSKRATIAFSAIQAGPAAASPRAMLFVAVAFCLGFLFVFNHVAVVSVLGTPRLAGGWKAPPRARRPSE